VTFTILEDKALVKDYLFIINKRFYIVWNSYWTWWIYSTLVFF